MIKLGRVGPKAVSKKWIIFIFLLVFLVPAAPSIGNTPSPEFQVGCFDYSITGSDYQGRYIEYLPTISVQFYGKKASVQVFVNNVRQSTIRISRSSKSFNLIEKIDASVRFYENETSLGKNNFKFIFIDSRKNRSTWICKAQIYESSFGSSFGIGSSGLSTYACTFDGTKLYGNVYFASSPYSADFTVYLTSSSYSSDLRVFFTNSSYFANSCGIWYRTSSPYTADFSVYVTSSAYSADFSIYVTNSSYFAGTR